MSENKANVLNLGSSPQKTVMKLAWPTIIEQLVVSVLTIADTAMVGTLGSRASASVGLIIPVTWVLSSIATAVSTGFSVVTAQSIGSDDMERANRSANKGIYFSIIFGLFVTAVCLSISGKLPVWMGAESDIVPLSSGYFFFFSFSIVFNIASATCSSMLRSCGETKIPLAVNSLAIFINLLLNYFLIFEPKELTLGGKLFTLYRAGMGVRGAALGTAGSLCISFILLMTAVFKNKRGIYISFKNMILKDRDIYKASFDVGIPVFFEKVTISLGQVFYMRILSTMGTTLVAAHHLASQAESLSYLPCFGFSIAATTLVGQAIGAKKYDEARHFGHIAARAGAVYGVLIGLVLFFLGRPIMMIFSSEEEVISIGANLLKIVALGQSLQAVAIIYAGALRGAGESKIPFFIGLSGIWGIRIVLCLITTFIFHLKLYTAWWIMLLDMCYRGIVITFVFRRRFNIIKSKAVSIE